jgi:DNA-binding SARP family transcriptional activator
VQSQPEKGLRIELFGGLRLLRNSCVEARLPPQKHGTLLAYLAYHSGQAHSREELIELFWPEVDPAAGRNRFKQTLSVLRTDPERSGTPTEDLILADRATVRLNADRITTDVAEFEAARLRAATALKNEQPILLGSAIGLYGGPLLPGFYDDWAVSERERLAQEYMDCLLALARILEAEGALERALDPARRAVAVDRSREEAHCALMRLLAALGRPAEAVRQYRAMERTLEEELGEAPSREAQDLFRSIKEGRIAAVSSVSAVPGPCSASRPCKIEPVGGAVPLSSEYYIVRATDQEFREAIARQDSIVLVKGPRQIGKTSLLARGLPDARERGARVVHTDLQRLRPDQLQSAEALVHALTDTLIEQLDLPIVLHDVWDTERGWNVNFERILRREILPLEETPLVWGLDEVDRLFSCAYASEIFGLFRSCHNLRALHPSGPWHRLTLAMAYATEAHLFVTDLNQSPFNVGTRLTLEDLTLDQIAELNRRYGDPLKSALEISRCHALLGGSPYQVRRGLHEMITRQLDLPALEAASQSVGGPFHDQLDRILQLVSDDPALLDCVRSALRGGVVRDVQSFYRLRSAGVLAGEPDDARFRCRLYANFLSRRLP